MAWLTLGAKLLRQGLGRGDKAANFQLLVVSQGPVSTGNSRSTDFGLIKGGSLTPGDQA